MKSGTVRRLRAQIALVVTFALTTVGLTLVTTTTAAAAPAPIFQPPASTVTADRLPTVQMDGVAWSQTVVGNTVYVAGRFNNARPAGAAAGTNLTPRANLLAYDITTGNLITSWAPSLNAQALSVSASPDGSRIYVAGDFSTANGQARRRVAAFFPVGHAQAGQLITAFNPSGPNSQARSVVATNSTVYVGGGFLGLQNGTLRNNLVAYDNNGAVLPWNPSATGIAGDPSAAVWALTKTADNATIFAGGQFQNVGGQPAYGLAKISASGTGALDTTWRPSVRNAGEDSGIASLIVQNNAVYGTAWHFGPGGNLEGVFKSPIDGATDPSDVSWVTDCHGDFYSSHLTNGIVYSVGHSHYCGNMGGGFPQYSTWKFQHAQAWSDTVTGDILNDVHGYPNWHGVEPGPAMANWTPDLAIGSFTGQGQAGWHITGTSNGDYVVYGGEFPRVNGVNQQGLVRFAKRPISPGTEGPRFAATPWAPTLVATSATSARVSWPSAWDRDDMTLTYKAIRTGVSTPRVTINANSQWWNTPRLGFTDTGLTPGATYSYRVVVNDPGGNTVNGSTVSITMPTTFAAAHAYASSVRAAGATMYWPMNETSGLNVTDRAAGTATGVNTGVNDGRGDTGVTWGQAGAIPGDTAASLGDNDWSRVYTLGQETAPDTFTIQGWVKTTTTSGGRIFGFGDLQNGNSGHRDRHLYMDNSGRLIFGVRAQNNSTQTVASSGTYRDNEWHMVTATMGPAGMALYVDGVRVGQRADTTQGEQYIGNWRLGGDNLGGWPSSPSKRNFIGTVDEIAVYPTALSQATILAQYEASGRTSTAPRPPVASFTVEATGLTVNVDGSGSSDPDGTIAGYSWNFGDGGTATGATASHTYATEGTHTITLTVTDNDGSTDTATQSVAVAGPNTPPVASFTASVNDLALSVDASASDDPDGTISSWAWNFGDGSTGSGETETHTYGAPGNYTVTLTVTDNDGDSDTTTRSVTAAAPTVIAADAFNRTVSNGWGPADTGGTWTLGTTSSNFAVAGGVGTMRVAAGSGPAAYLNSVSARDVDLTTSFSYDKPGTGGGIYTSALVRRIGTSDYRVKVRVTATATTLSLVRMVSGTETTLSSETVSGLVVGANDVLNMRLQAEGNGTTNLRAKIWRGGTSEPGSWNLTSSDTTAALQAAGATGMYNYLSGSATNSPITISVADFRLVPLP